MHHRGQHIQRCDTQCQMHDISLSHFVVACLAYSTSAHRTTASFASCIMPHTLAMRFMCFDFSQMAVLCMYDCSQWFYNIFIVYAFDIYYVTYQTCTSFFCQFSLSNRSMRFKVIYVLIHLLQRSDTFTNSTIEFFPKLSEKYGKFQRWLIWISTGKNDCYSARDKKWMNGVREKGSWML